MEFVQHVPSGSTSQPVVLVFASSENPRRRYITKPRDANSPYKKRVGNRVLMVGRVRELALYRAEVLRQAGFTAVIASDVDEAVGIMQRRGFDAIVLSYTLPSDTVQYLASAARDYCADCAVVAIAEKGILDGRVEPDAVATAEEGPTALLAALRQVLEP